MINISKEAADFYRREMELSDGEALKFFVRHGGHGAQEFGFGIEKDIPQDVTLVQKVGDVSVYCEPGDAWFFENLNLAFNEELNEPFLTGLDMPDQ